MNIKKKEEDWDYFSKDKHYSNVLKDRLTSRVEMDSAMAMSDYMEKYFRGDLDILDFGGGPGHYYEVIKNKYKMGQVSYTSVDIDEDNINFGSDYFRSDQLVKFLTGSVLEPATCYDGQNCIISANTLPHVPSIEPLLCFLASSEAKEVKYFIFRMLIGSECVQIKKHLSENEFTDLFYSNFQYNNIYSMKYLNLKLENNWNIEQLPDIFDIKRLDKHKLPAEEVNPFYSNRVSKAKGGMIFKGDIYMPWHFVIGQRKT